MSPLDIIELPGYPGMYGRRALVDAWIAAGSPRPNSAGRLYAQQKYYWDGWVARLPGFNPADNPDDESQRLAHVRFAALDIDPTPDRVRRLAAAGLIRPYTYEQWHWELPNVRSFPIVRSIPTPSKEEDMPLDANADYPAFATMLQRALKFDARPNGVGATYELGPTVFESLAGAQNKGVTDAQVKAIADAVVKAIGKPTVTLDYAAIAKAVNDDAGRRMDS